MLHLQSIPNFVPNICSCCYPAARSQLRTWSLKSFTSNVSTNYGRNRCSTSQEACWLPPQQKGAFLSGIGSPKQAQRTIRCRVGTDVDGATEGQPADEDEFPPAKDESAQDYVDFCTGEWAGTFTVSVHLFAIPATNIWKHRCDSGNVRFHLLTKLCPTV